MSERDREHPAPAGATEPYHPSGSTPGAACVRGYRLEIAEGPDAPRIHEVASLHCAIGSAPSCDLVLDDPTVSRFHCELDCDGNRVRVRDLGSRNGTVVSGVQIESAFLRSGNLLRLGRTVLRFERLDRTTPLELSTRERFGHLVGTSVATRAVFAGLERAAGSRAKVLLQGESGTGKTATAESIHLESERRDGPFVVVDCGALPANLLESELFGHVKGAFTGAVSERLGAFEQADGGTLFLDEIGEIPLDLQAKLLRALDRGEIQRVGDDKRKPRKVDVRVITATNRELRAAVNSRLFREDLYYRIAVLVIRLPALRERTEDLPALARTLLQRSDYPESEWRPLLTESFLAQLATGAWPGNIRELANHLERCMVYSRPQPIEHPHHGPRPAAGEKDSGGEPEPIVVDLEMSWERAREQALAQVERRYFGGLLAVHGSVASARGVARVNSSTYYKKLRAHGISAESDKTE